MIESQDEIIGKIKARIDEAERIAVFGHVRPDGDAIGSVLGMGWALELAGKQVQFVSNDDLPRSGIFRIEDFVEKIPFVKEPGPFDCSILLDISDIRRAGDYFNREDSPIPDICIDHHVSNPGIAKINWVDPEAAATAILVARLIPHLGLQMNLPIATALLSGIISDTQTFSTRNTNPESLRISADLIEQGADLYDLILTVVKAHSFEAGKYWGYGLGKMQLADGVLWSTLTLEDQKKSGYEEDDDANLINFLSSTTNAAVSVLFIEMSASTVRVSWRALPGTDVSKIAEKFGGGGHVLASGATIFDSLDLAIPPVLEMTKRMMSGRSVSTEDER